jgi:hypothetical protein
MSKNSGEDGSLPFRASFFRMLAEDVISALERRALHDTQSSRRDLIRTLFVAIEGSVWELREHVLDIAKSLDDLPPLMAMALRETSYIVTENGRLIEQPRFIPLASMIKLVTAFAKELNHELAVGFAGEGWADFKRSSKIRNRVTHPKRLDDLMISSEDLTIAWSGFFWIHEHVEQVMRSTNDAASKYFSDLEDLCMQLQSGDPKALNAYRAALDAADD